MSATAFPEWLEPMAATLTQDRFTGPDWIVEQKLDGIRLLAFKNGTNVRLLSRNRLPQQLPNVAAAVARLTPDDVILDGELTWGTQTPGYHVFDIMRLSGADLTSLPLDARRVLLNQLRFEPPLHHVPAISDPEPWELARRQGWEGIVVKRLGSKYEHRRSPHWLKMKCETTADLVVGGFTDPRGTRVGLGALLVGHFEAADFVFAGKVGTGFDRSQLLALRERLDRLEIAASPFTRASGLPRLGSHWTRPEVVVQVAFIEWTVHGKLRHPRLLVIRDAHAAGVTARNLP